LETPLQARLLLCERIISLLQQAAQVGVWANLRSQAGAWERGEGGMRFGFPPYALNFQKIWGEKTRQERFSFALWRRLIYHSAKR
jgi:hypothetical protein